MVAENSVGKKLNPAENIVNEEFNTARIIDKKPRLGDTVQREVVVENTVDKAPKVVDLVKKKNPGTPGTTRTPWQTWS